MSYYEQIVCLLRPHLGPAAERFVTRQIEFHLEKPVEELTKKDVERLAESLPNSLTLLHEKKKTIDQLVKKILALTSKPSA